MRYNIDIFFYKRTQLVNHRFEWALMGRRNSKIPVSRPERVNSIKRQIIFGLISRRRCVSGSSFLNGVFKD